MGVRAIKMTMLVVGLMVQDDASLANPVLPKAAPIAVQAHAARPVAGHTEAMIAHTGADRHGAAPRAANGIAGADLVRPVARSAVGGASTRSGGIDGGTVHRRP